MAPPCEFRSVDTCLLQIAWPVSDATASWFTSIRFGANEWIRLVFIDEKLRAIIITCCLCRAVQCCARFKTVGYSFSLESVSATSVLLAVRCFCVTDYDSPKTWGSFWQPCAAAIDFIYDRRISLNYYYFEIFTFSWMFLCSSIICIWVAERFVHATY